MDGQLGAAIEGFVASMLGFGVALMIGTMLATLLTPLVHRIGIV